MPISPSQFSPPQYAYPQLPSPELTSPQITASIPTHLVYPPISSELIIITISIIHFNATFLPSMSTSEIVFFLNNSSQYPLSYLLLLNTSHFHSGFINAPTDNNYPSFSIVIANSPNALPTFSPNLVRYSSTYSFSNSSFHFFFFAFFNHSCFILLYSSFFALVYSGVKSSLDGSLNVYSHMPNSFLCSSE